MINNNISAPNKVVNLHISYILSPWLRNLKTGFTLNNCLFGSVNVTKNADLDKYMYSGYGIGFDSRSEFSLPDGSIEKNVITFGANMSSSVHIDNKYIYILVTSEGPTRESNDTTTLTAEAEYLIYFKQSGKRFV